MPEFTDEEIGLIKGIFIHNMKKKVTHIYACFELVFVIGCWVI